jgi:hydroxymethylbilane synthase
VLHIRPDLKVMPIRGNVETRLRKLAEGECDAIILAEAGLKRLGFAERITEFLEPPRFLPAVGQGALGLETRREGEIRSLIAALDDAPSRASVVAERAFLAALQGGCLAPIGAYGQIDSRGQLRLDGVVLSPDGRQRLAGSLSADPLTAVDLGRRLAEEMKKKGAGPLLDSARAI